MGCILAKILEMGVVYRGEFYEPTRQFVIWVFFFLQAMCQQMKKDKKGHGFRVEQECPTMYIEASRTFNLHASKTQQRI
jgi:hypothetical protein